MFYDELISDLEALLFAAGEPLLVDKIAELLKIEAENVEYLIGLLEKEYEKAEHGICLVKVASGYQLVTKPQYDSLVRSLMSKQELKLSNAAMETLAIIAFKQPVTRSEIEAIRGVKADSVVNTLVEYGLIIEAGRKNSLGRPILYATTDLFLSTFGLNSLADLPKLPEDFLLKQEALETATE